MIIGLLNSSVIFENICQRLQPSIRAASSMARGTVSKKPLAI